MTAVYAHNHHVCGSLLDAGRFIYIHSNEPTYCSSENRLSHKVSRNCNSLASINEASLMILLKSIARGKNLRKYFAQDKKYSHTEKTFFKYFIYNTINYIDNYLSNYDIIDKFALIVFYAKM